MSALTLASSPEDAAALDAAEANHARLAGELSGRVALLLDAADRDPAAAGRIRAGLVDFCDSEVLPHAVAEEATLYPAAHGTPAGRLLIESLIAEHNCLAALVDSLRAAPTPSGAAADARALQVLFEEHMAKDTGLVLPLLAVTPGVDLAALVAELQATLTPDVPRGAGGCGCGGCGCGAADEEDVPAGTTPDESPQVQAQQSAGGCGGGCGCGEEDDEDVPELDVREVPHALRHATVFGALDAVPAGSAMVLVAPHDPLPLLAQIEQRHPGAFSVEYLERGPEAWRLQLSHR